MTFMILGLQYAYSRVTDVIRLNALQKIPRKFQTPEFRVLAWTLWILPVIQCLALGLATPNPVSFINNVSGFLFWVCAIVPLWWLTHFTCKWILARTGTKGKQQWFGLALASALAFVVADVAGYFYLLYLVFSQWLGVFQPPFVISTPQLSNIISKPVLLGALGHAVIWLTANLSARFLLGRTLYDQDHAGTDPIPLFLHRVPKNLRQNLLAIQAQEHYINVHTAEGSELILYRFGDALMELNDTPGMQVHRSYWVAEGSVSSYERKNGQLLLTLSNGQKVPVSRSFIRDVEQSGFLPVT